MFWSFYSTCARMVLLFWIILCSLRSFYNSAHWKVLVNYLTTLISKFMKVILQHPTLPLYVNIWDINVLFAYFEYLPANCELTLKCLTEKLIALLLILIKQRKQTLLVIDTDNVKIYEYKLIILPNSSPKHTNPSRPLQSTVYHKFNGNPKLCSWMR